eukprot:916020-Alexandrium_andersonii.AAC.1
MSASLVGSEMCIRDRPCLASPLPRRAVPCRAVPCRARNYNESRSRQCIICLLYTSDAADDM